MRTTIVAVLFLVLSSAGVKGQSASETVRGYFDAVQKQDYEASVAHYHPRALKDFRQMMSFLDEFPVTEEGDLYEALFGAGITREAVAKMSDGSFMATFTRMVMSQGDAAGGIRFDSVEVLGEVPEGPDVLHVLTRNKISAGEAEIESLEVVSMRRNGDGWKIQLSGKMKGIAQQLRTALSQAEEP